MFAFAANRDPGHRQHDWLAVPAGHKRLFGHAQVEQAAQQARHVAVDLVEFAVLHPDQRVRALELYSGELDQHVAGLDPTVARPQHALDIVCRHGYSLSWQHGSEHMYAYACIIRSTAPAIKARAGGTYGQPRTYFPGPTLWLV